MRGDGALGARPPGRPLVLGNMVASVDGHVTVDGGSTGLGGEGDKAMFHALRGVVDAVLAGAGPCAPSATAGSCAHPSAAPRAVALGLDADPAMLLVSRSGDVPWEAPLFEVPEQRVGIACAGEPDVPAHVQAQLTFVGSTTRRRGRRSPRSARRSACAASCARAGRRSTPRCSPTASSTSCSSPSRPRSPASRPTPPAWCPSCDAARDLQLRWVLRAGDELLLRYAVSG